MSVLPGRVSLQPAVAQKAAWRLQKKESEGERGGSMEEDMGGMTRQQRNKCRRLGFLCVSDAFSKRFQCDSNPFRCGSESL